MISGLKKKEEKERGSGGCGSEGVVVLRGLFMHVGWNIKK